MWLFGVKSAEPQRDPEFTTACSITPWEDILVPMNKDACISVAETALEARGLRREFPLVHSLLPGPHVRMIVQQAIMKHPRPFLWRMDNGRVCGSSSPTMHYKMLLSAHVLTILQENHVFLSQVVSDPTPVLESHPQTEKLRKLVLALCACVDEAIAQEVTNGPDESDAPWFIRRDVLEDLQSLTRALACYSISVCSHNYSALFGEKGEQSISRTVAALRPLRRARQYMACIQSAQEFAWGDDLGIFLQFVETEISNNYKALLLVLFFQMSSCPFPPSAPEEELVYHSGGRVYVRPQHCVQAVSELIEAGRERIPEDVFKSMNDYLAASYRLFEIPRDTIADRITAVLFERDFEPDLRKIEDEGRMNTLMKFEGSAMHTELPDIRLGLPCQFIGLPKMK